MSSSGFDDSDTSSLSPPPATITPPKQSVPLKKRQSTLKVKRIAPAVPPAPSASRPRDEDIFAAAVAASRTGSSAALKKQTSFSSVLDEIMSEDDDNDGDDEDSSAIVPAAPVAPVKRPRKRPGPKPKSHASTPSSMLIASAMGSSAVGSSAESTGVPSPTAASSEVSSPAPEIKQPEIVMNESDLDDEGEDDSELAVAGTNVKSETKPERKRLMPNPREPLYAPEISFLVMFRSRFAELYTGYPDLGPQDFEEGLVTTPPGADVESFLCRTLSLVLNRKKNIEPGHFGRPIDEAVSSNGPAYWGPLNPTGPFIGDLTFYKMDWDARLEVLVALVHWSLTNSEAVRQVLLNGYAQQRMEDDRNCQLAVTPVGLDSERRRYYLIEGQSAYIFLIFFILRFY